MSFKMRAERTSCARHITLDWIEYLSAFYLLERPHIRILPYDHWGCNQAVDSVAWNSGVVFRLQLMYEL